MADEIKSEALSENEAGQAAAATPQTASANADAPQASKPQADEQQAVSEESGTQAAECFLPPDPRRRYTGLRGCRRGG